MTDSRRPRRVRVDPDAVAQGPGLSEHVRRTHSDPVLRRLMLLVTAAVVLGLIGTAAAVVGATQTRTASQASVARGLALTRLLAEEQRASEQRTYDTRVDNRLLLEAICEQIEAVRERVPTLEGVPDCPRLPPVPRPRPQVSPSPR